MALVLVSVESGYKSQTLMFASVRKRYIMSLISKSSDLTVFPKRESHFKIKQNNEITIKLVIFQVNAIQH